MAYNKSIGRIIIIIFFATGIGQPVNAQTFDEWFRQRATQKDYLLKQIAALKVYLGHVQKGYNIAQKGLTTISGIKSGDIRIHQVFFNSLKDINVAISRTPAMTDIEALHRKIMLVYSDINHRLKDGHALEPGMVQYIQSVFARLLDDCEGILAELALVAGPQSLEMKDDERITRLEGLRTQMQGNYGFVQKFGSQVKIMMIQQHQTAGDIQSVRVLQGNEK